jgi:hypothetical protein
MEIVVIILVIAFCAWLDGKESEEQADPVALALPAVQDLEREAQQALAEIRALDNDGRRQS